MRLLGWRSWGGERKVEQGRARQNRRLSQVPSRNPLRGVHSMCQEPEGERVERAELAQDQRKHNADFSLKGFTSLRAMGFGVLQVNWTLTPLS